MGDHLSNRLGSNNISLNFNMLKGKVGPTFITFCVSVSEFSTQFNKSISNQGVSLFQLTWHSKY